MTTARRAAPLAALLLAAAAPARIDLAHLAAHHVALHSSGDTVALRPDTGASPQERETYAVLPGVTFTDGDIALELRADRVPGAPEAVRAFAGVAFRLEGAAYEAFYIRLYNGRAHDQLQRNHAAQYISHPDWTWQRLRRETPGAYESYVDLLPGRWTALRVHVCGQHAQLFVDGAPQPVLVVHDLKRGAAATGGVALWVGPGTAAAFRAVTITSTPHCPPPP